jgi:hypothetical protein
MRKKGVHRRKIQINCYICGAPSQKLTNFAGKKKWMRFAWACPDCRNRAVRPMLMEKKCKVCGTIFRGLSENRACSKSCYTYLNLNMSKPKPNTCVDCGEKLTGVKHTSSSRHVCDLCMMERRRSYKDKAEYGDLAEAFNLARTAKIIAYVGQEIVTKGESSWLKKYPIWKQKIQRLKSTL